MQLGCKSGKSTHDHAAFLAALLRSHMPALRRLDVDYAYLDWQAGLRAPMPDGAWVLSALEVLRLHACAMTPNEGSALAHADGGLPALQALSLADSDGLGNAGAVALGSAATALRSLRSLDFSRTGLSGGSGVAAMAGVWRSQLVRLDISDSEELCCSGAAAVLLRLRGPTGQRCGGWMWALAACTTKASNS